MLVIPVRLGSVQKGPVVAICEMPGSIMSSMKEKKNWESVYRVEMRSTPRLEVLVETVANQNELVTRTTIATIGPTA